MRVIDGEHKGRKGMVFEVVDGVARLRLTKYMESASIPLNCLRREYRHDEDAPSWASLTLSARRRISQRKRDGLKP